LSNIGYEIGRTTIKRILSDHGIEPAPERGKYTRWSTFLKAHWGAIAGIDFFTVEVLNFRGLVRYFVLFVIDLKTRRVEIAGLVAQPEGRWMKQMARNLTDVRDGFLADGYYVIHDRDPLFTTEFRAILRGGGVTPVKLPAKSPDLNAYAERFVRSIRDECLNRVVPLGERHLRELLREFVDHYHMERNHQGLDNQLINPVANVVSLDRQVKKRQRLGGVLNYYYREAA
jgi:transposase InsO family protein